MVQSVNLVIFMAFLAFSTASNKQLSFFNVVKFPDDICNADNGKQGTCLTKEACDDKGGFGSGDCADGYGICCVVALDCGQTSNSNITFLNMTATQPERTCEYRICKSKDTICRMKFEFNTFNIHPPTQGEAKATGASTTNGGSIGHCDDDAFSISSPGNAGSPIICGFNTGQHMYVDVPSTDCVQANFLFGKSTFTRTYEIRVLQFQCGAEMGGPPGCLQYFTSTSGTFASFNYPTNTNTVAATTTHLANQFYRVCFRRASKNCGICFGPKVAGSFGLSISPDTTPVAAKAGDNGPCDADYIIIPFGTLDETMASSPSIAFQGSDRHCGRFLNAKNAVASTTICTNFRPFMVSVNFDDSEEAVGAAANTNEQHELPGGIIGFHLTFTQKRCT